MIIDKQGKLRDFDTAKFVHVWCGSHFGVALDGILCFHFLYFLLPLTHTYLWLLTYNADKGTPWLFGMKIEPNVSHPCLLLLVIRRR